MGVMGVARMSSYEEGSPEQLAYLAGIERERIRLTKVLNTYHKRFCEGLIEDHPECKKTMEIRYLYEFIEESKTLK